MRKMQEEDFDKLAPTVSPAACRPHEFVKLYFNGAHTDYVREV